MAVANRKEFIACITKSKAIDADKLNEWLDSVDEEAPKKIATKLVRDELLTPWQAKFLLSGRSRLNVGNYVLQKRISRDELGDKFEAVHSQLNRRVLIQVFPSSVSKDEKLLNKLLTKLRAITEFDHPNLVHVYDVDQEGERYFLVTEFVEGESLDSISPKDLTDKEIAVIINGIGAGLAFSHEREIMHGNLSPENIIVKPNGKAKLEGFPAAAVTSETASDAKPPSVGSDFRRLSKIGLAFLKKLPESFQSEDYESINGMITGLKSSKEREASLASLGEWVSSHTAATSDSSLQSAEDTFVSSDSSGDAGDFDSPMSTVAATKLEKKETPPETPEGETDEQETRSWLIKMWEEKRAAVITSAAALSLLLAGGLVALGMAIGGGGGSTAPESLVAANKTEKKIKLNAPSSAKAVDEVLDPDANRKKLEKFFKEKENKAKEPKNTKRSERIARRKQNEADAKAKEEKEKSKADVPTDAAEPKEKEETAPEKPSEKAKPDAKKSSSKAAPAKKKSADKPPAKIGNPFTKFVKTTDLPEASNTKDFKIADLVIEKNHLLGLKIISAPPIARSKIGFNLNRSSDDKQLWNVELAPKRSSPITVAQFQKTPTEMKFRWLPAAAEQKDANYLRNCLLDLSTPKDSTTLRLRSPIEIEDFKLTEDGGAAKAQLELPWSPSPNSIKVELQPFEIGRRADRVSFEPRVFQTQDSGRVFFRDKPSERFFFIDVTAEPGKKIKFEAQMTLSLPNGKLKSLNSMEDLVKFSTALDAEKAAAAFRSEQLDKIRAKTRPPNMTNDELVALRKQAKATASGLANSFDLTQKYIKLSKEVSGKVIPLQLYFEIEEYRIVLAEAKNSK